MNAHYITKHKKIRSRFSVENRSRVFEKKNKKNKAVYYRFGISTKTNGFSAADRVGGGGVRRRRRRAAGSSGSTGAAALVARGEGGVDGEGRR